MREKNCYRNCSLCLTNQLYHTSISNDVEWNWTEFISHWSYSGVFYLFSRSSIFKRNLKIQFQTSWIIFHHKSSYLSSFSSYLERWFQSRWTSFDHWISLSNQSITKESCFS
jgi:hypothetical protein